MSITDIQLPDRGTQPSDKVIEKGSKAKMTPGGGGELRGKNQHEKKAKSKRIK